MSARNLVAALGGRWHGSYGEARCPAHDDRSPSLSVREGDTAPLLTCHAGCERSAVVDALKARGLWEGRERQHRSARPATRPTAPEQHRNQDCALAIWRECEPSAGTVTETYLRGRRITIAIPPTLRYHRCLKHYETGLTFPALVAGVQGPHRGI